VLSNRLNQPVLQCVLPNVGGNQRHRGIDW